jgi:hypothetical protein
MALLEKLVKFGAAGRVVRFCGRAAIAGDFSQRKEK